MSDAPNGSAIRLLLVDDEPANLLSLEAVLEGLGATIVTARSGEEALRALVDDTFAVVLLDVQLPGMSGYETAKRIRRHGPSRGTPIIFITAYDDDPSFPVTEAYALGAVDYLVKPIIPVILRTKVTVFIDLFRRTQAAARAETRARERLEKVLATVNDMFLVLDGDLRYTFVNDRMVEASGIPRERLVGRRLQEVFPDTAGSLVESELRRALDERVPVHFEFYHAAHDRWFDNRAYPSREGLLLVTTEITAAKKAEERFRLTADRAPVLIWIAGVDGRCTWFNQHWLEFTGRTMPQELGTGWTEGLHPEDLPRAWETYTTHFDARTAFRMEYRLRHRGGEYRWVIDNGIPLYGTGGEFTGYIGSCVDIHDRKVAEGRQGLLAEAGRILGSSLDYEVTLSQVSRLVVPGFADWCGLDLLTDDGHLRHLASVHEDPARVALAEEFWARYPPRPEDQGGYFTVLETGEPILHRELTDEELVAGARDAEHLAMLRALGLKSFIIVPMTARGRTLGTLTLANSESPRLFGTDDLNLAQELASRAALAVDNARLFTEAQEAVGRREEALALHRSVEEQLTLLVEASGSLSASLELPAVLGAILALSSRLISADAHAVWRYEPSSGRWAIAHGSGLSERYKDSAIEVLAETPRMPERPIIAEDVLAAPRLGEREKAYESEGIRSLLAVPLKVRREVDGSLVFYYRSPHRFSEVEVRVATALSNLAGSAIGIAELYDELKEAGRRKDEFLAMLAHELRNPLSAIGNAASLLQLPEIDDEDREWATQVISRQVKHLSRLMDDLLDVSRVSRGKIHLKARRLDAASVIRHAIETTQPLINERRHTLNVSYDSGVLELDADPTRLEQVIVNLLGNAAKYTDAGGSLWLTARRDGANIAITVRDNGIGIAPERLPQMFELFAQGDRSLARSEGGLGIGLTLVKSLVELHGGSVHARSDGPGQGSEFTVRLPAAPPSDPAAGRPSPGDLPARPGGKRILVIDDNLDTARGMARLLKLAGHEVTLAPTGPEGIESALARRPDVILLDIGLPGMDGYEVARKLRQVDHLANILIVAVSGYCQDEDRRRSQSAGIDHHLVKPIDHDALVTLIAAC
jgi:PAS domain S-box-containing protein